MFFVETKYSFEGQHPDEKVILFSRRHWFVILLPMIAFAIMALIPLILYIFTESLFARMGLTSIVLFVFTIYYVIWWLSLSYKITMYLMDYWIITDKRVIDSRQHGFFSRSVATAQLNRIQDVTTSINGPMATWLDFGNIEVQTAGTENNFFFYDIPNPAQMRGLIMEVIERRKGKQNKGSYDTY